MYIGIDGNEANVEKRVGSNVYAHQILLGLKKFDTKTNYQVYLKQSLVADMPTVTNNWDYRIFGPKPAWTRWRLPFDLFTHFPRPKLFFTPGHYSPAFSPVPTVITIMDLAFLYFPETFKPSVLNQLKSWTKSSALSASHIFTISENSKKDIIKEYGISPGKITVTYPGSNIESIDKPSTNTVRSTLKKLSLPDKYFLFIGTNQPRKNLARLISSFAQFSKTDPDTKLVIVGKTWHQFENLKLTLPDNVIQLDYLKTQDLISVLSGATALVFPSLYEGFGLPVLEAMQLGVPVAASSVSSVPEITGDSPFLFDPLNEVSITKALIEISSLSTEKRQNIIKQGKIRSSQFTWENCTKKTMEVLHELAV